MIIVHFISGKKIKINDISLTENNLEGWISDKITIIETNFRLIILDGSKIEWIEKILK